MYLRAYQWKSTPERKRCWKENTSNNRERLFFFYDYDFEYDFLLRKQKKIKPNQYRKLEFRVILNTFKHNNNAIGI